MVPSVRSRYRGPAVARGPSVEAGGLGSQAEEELLLDVVGVPVPREAPPAPLLGLAENWLADATGTLTNEEGPCRGSGPNLNRSGLSLSSPPRSPTRSIHPGIGQEASAADSGRPSRPRPAPPSLAPGRIIFGGSPPTSAYSLSRRLGEACGKAGPGCITSHGSRPGAPTVSVAAAPARGGNH